MRRKRNHFLPLLALVIFGGAVIAVLLKGDLRLRAYRQFSRSASRGELGVVRGFLAMGLDPNHRVPGVWPPLIAAAAGGDDELVRYLINHGADVNLQAKSGLSALEAAVHGGSVPVTRTLLAHGAKVDPIGEEGTPLMVAVQKCDEQLTEVLLNAGAEVDLALPWGQSTARELARASRCPEIKQMVEAWSPKQSP